MLPGVRTFSSGIVANYTSCEHNQDDNNSKNVLMRGISLKICDTPQVAQARNMSIGEHRSALLRNIRNIRICMGKKPIASVTYENKRISIKNSLPYIKFVLRLSCVVHGPIYGRFMGCTVNGFVSTGNTR